MNTLVKYYAELASSFNKANGAFKAIDRLYTSENIRPLLTLKLLGKMENFFSEYLFIMNEVDFLALLCNINDSEPTDNLSIDIDCLIDLAKNIMNDVKAIVYKAS